MREFYCVPRTGSLKNLVYRQSDVPTIQSGKVLVDVKAVGLNYADLFAIMGLYSATPKGTFIPGLEFAGVVLESDAADFPRGQRVMGVTRFGGYDSHILCDHRYLIHLPDEWSYSEGAAYPVQSLTAYYALHPLGNLQKGQTVLIHSAAGGVGLQANRIALKSDAYTIGVVGSETKLKVLESEGYKHAIVRDRNFRRNLDAALSGRELHLVLEAGGGEYFRHSFNALAPMGRIVCYGSAQFTPSSDRPNYLTLIYKYLCRPKIDPLSMITANKSVMAFNLIWLYERHELMQDLLRQLNLLNLPAPMVGHTFAFDKLKDAVRLLKSGTSVGKVVVTRP